MTHSRAVRLAKFQPTQTATQTARSEGHAPGWAEGFEPEGTSDIEQLKWIAQHRNAFTSFVASAAELFQNLESNHTALSDNETLLRRIHGIKGGAAIFGLESVAFACHEIENKLLKGEPAVSWPNEARTLRALLQAKAEFIEKQISALLLEPPTESQKYDQGQSNSNGRISFREALRHYETSLSSLAEVQNRQFSGVCFRGGEILVPCEELTPLLMSLVHAFRNSIVHGLESVEERRARGKSSKGSVFVNVHQTEKCLSLAVADDGRGIDPDQVRRLLALRGELAHLDESDENVIQAILSEGFSTASEVTMVAGRGFGLSAIVSEVMRLGGQIEVRSILGEGMCLEILIPLPVTLRGHGSPSSAA